MIDYCIWMLARLLKPDITSSPETEIPALWIGGKIYDSIFFLPVLPIAVFFLAYFIFSYSLGYAALFFWTYTLLFRLPHFAALAEITWLNKNSRPKMDVFKFYAVPLCIFLIYTLPALLHLGSKNTFVLGLSLFTYVIGMQHIAMQNYGILKIFRIKQKALQTKLEILCEKYALLNVTVIYFIEVLRHTYEFSLSEIDYLRWVKPGLHLILAVQVGTLLFFLIKNRSSFSKVSPGTIHFFISCLVMYPWPFSKNNFELTFYLFNFHHSLAYMGLIWLITKKQIAPSRSAPFIFYFKFFAAGIVLYFFSKFSFLKSYSGQFSVFYCFFVIHYYVESIIWRHPSGLASDYLSQITKP